MHTTTEYESRVTVGDFSTFNMATMLKIQVFEFSWLFSGKNSHTLIDSSGIFAFSDVVLVLSPYESEVGMKNFPLVPHMSQLSSHFLRGFAWHFPSRMFFVYIKWWAFEVGSVSSDIFPSRNTFFMYSPTFLLPKFRTNFCDLHRLYSVSRVYS